MSNIDVLTKEQKQPYCDKITGFVLFTKEIWTPKMVALQAVSSIGLLFIAYTIFYNPNLRQHPADLIGYIFTVLAVICYMSFSVYTICPGHGQALFAATVYFDTS